jgi:transposase-like protein
VTENHVQTQTRLDASNRAEVLAEYVAGASVRELADRFGIHRATMSDIARLTGVKVRHPELPNEVRTRAARLRNEGMTLAQVAKKLRIGGDAVRSAVVTYGGTIPLAGRRRSRT